MADFFALTFFTVLFWIVSGVQDSSGSQVTNANGQANSLPGTTSISANCQADLTIFEEEFQNNPYSGWASVMADSYGQPESGRWSGNSMFEGRALQCAQVDADRTGSDGKPYKGRHCTLAWAYFLQGTDDPLYGYYGICLPTSCAKEDVLSIVLDQPQGNLPYPLSNDPNLSLPYCEEYDKDLFADNAVIGATALLCFFGLLIFVGTLYEAVTLLMKPKPNKDGNRNNNANTNNNAATGEPEVDYEAGIRVEKPALSSMYLPNTGQNDHHNPYSNHWAQGAKEFYVNGAFRMSSGNMAATATPNDMKQFEIADNSASVYVPAKDKPRSSDDYNPWGTFGELLLAFSVYKNAHSLASVDHPRGSVHCVHGIRFLAMCWIILGHSWQLGITITAGPTVENTVDIGTLFDRVTFSAINQMNISVETFFVLSAMLTTMSLLRQFKKNNNRPSCTMFGLYYFHRYWRLTPVYMILLMVWTVFFPYLLSGHFVPGGEVDSCKETWWKHPIYLNNLIDFKVENECFGWTWYLANDFQFYVIAPLFIGLLFWVPIAGIVMTLLAMAGSFASTLYLFHGVFVREDTEVYQDVYVKPWSRSLTYFMGIFLGYILFKKNRNIKMHPALVVFGWLVALAYIGMAVYITGNVPTTPEGRMVAYSFQRPMMALGVCWIVLACTCGYGGVINSILSWRGWVPLSRLTYTGYLIHPMLIYYTYYKSPLQIYVTDWNMIYYFLGHFMLTIGTSFVVSVTLELPFSAMEKVMFKNVKK